MSKKKDAATRVANNIGEWLVGKGCVMHSDALKEYAAGRIRRAICDAVTEERKRNQAQAITIYDSIISEIVACRRQYEESEDKR